MKTNQEMVELCLAGKWQEIIARLENHEWDPNAKLVGETPDYESTLLLYAAERGAARLAQRLIELGADVNWQDEVSGVTALIQASQMGHEEIVALLLSARADVQAKTKSGDFGDRGETALLEAAQGGYIGVVRKLLQAGARVTDRTRKGLSALSKALSGQILSTTVVSAGDIKEIASFGGKLKRPVNAVAEYLKGKLSPLVQQAIHEIPDGSREWTLMESALVDDLNRIPENGLIYDPLLFPEILLRPRTKALLLQSAQGARQALLNRWLLEDAFPTEFARGHILELVEMLLAADAPVDGRDLHGRVALRDLEIVKLLLSREPDVNARYDWPTAGTDIIAGDTPLLAAVTDTTGEAMAKRGSRFGTLKPAERLAIVDLLLSAGADVNAPRLKYGFTPLLLAALFDEAEIAERLIRAGADPNQEFECKTMRGRWEPDNRKSEPLSALKLARQKKRNKKIRKLLLGQE